MTLNVLVTNACAPSGQSMIDALQNEPVNVLSCDVRSQAQGLDAVPAEHRFVVHRDDDPEFIGDLVSLCLRHEIDILVPTSEREQTAIARARSLFEQFGTRVWLAPIPAHVTRSQARRIVHLGERSRTKDAINAWFRRLSAHADPVTDSQRVA